jgi:hypothetical protein
VGAPGGMAVVADLGTRESVCVMWACGARCAAKGLSLLTSVSHP